MSMPSRLEAVEEAHGGYINCTVVTTLAILLAAPSSPPVLALQKVSKR